MTQPQWYREWLEKTLAELNAQKKQQEQTTSQSEKELIRTEFLRSSHLADELLMTEAEKRAKKRLNILEKAFESFCYLDGRAVQGYPSWLSSLTEVKMEAERLDLYTLQNKVLELEEILNFETLREKLLKQIWSEVVVTKCNRPPNFNIKTLSKDAQRELKNEVDNRFQAYKTHFERLKKSVPYLKKTLEVYKEALSILNATKPTAEYLADKQKLLQKLRKNAEKIVNNLEKVVHQITYDRPTSDRLSKACILIQGYREIQSEFYSINKQLEKFNINLGVSLPSLPLLPDAVKKALSYPSTQTQKKVTNILSKFKWR
jgi:hypothetical protein